MRVAFVEDAPMEEEGEAKASPPNRRPSHSNHYEQQRRHISIESVTTLAEII